MFSHSMDSILSVQNRNFSGDGKESTKILRAVGKSQESLTLTSRWNWANPLKTYHESIVHERLIDPRRKVLRRDHYAERMKERLLCCCNQACIKMAG